VSVPVQRSEVHRLSIEEYHQLVESGGLDEGTRVELIDLAVFERTDPAMTHPSAALLVIEVAVSSRDPDLRLKPAVYAGAVTEYWVVDLERSCVVVHRNSEAPSSSPRQRPGHRRGRGRVRALACYPLWEGVTGERLPTSPSGPRPPWRDRYHFLITPNLAPGRELQQSTAGVAPQIAKAR